MRGGGGGGDGARARCSFALLVVGNGGPLSLTCVWLGRGRRPLDRMLYDVMLRRIGLAAYHGTVSGSSPPTVGHAPAPLKLLPLPRALRPRPRLLYYACSSLPYVGLAMHAVRLVLAPP